MESPTLSWTTDPARGAPASNEEVTGEHPEEPSHLARGSAGSSTELLNQQDPDVKHWGAPRWASLTVLGSCHGLVSLGPAGCCKPSQHHTRELCYEAQPAGPDPHTSLLLGASTFRYSGIKTATFPLAPEQHFCAHSRTPATANPGSRGHHAARQHQGLMGFGHSCWDGWMQHHPSGAQLHVPWACNEMKTPFGKKLEAPQTIPSPECWSF